MKWLIASIILVSPATSISGQTRPCTMAEAQRAEREADGLRSWDDLYKSYRQYAHCDDGAIAEGYSESVVRILSDHWNTLPRLAAIAKNDSKFYKFVLRHIDETVALEDLQKITVNASAKCPKGLHAFCADIRKSSKPIEEGDAAH